jgi:hypothetical protein
VPTPEVCNALDDDCNGYVDDNPTECGLNRQNRCLPAGEELVCVPGDCMEGFIDCDGLDETGCELESFQDRNHCGGCDNQCEPDEACLPDEGCVSSNLDWLVHARSDRQPAPLTAFDVSMDQNNMYLGLPLGPSQDGTVGRVGGTAKSFDNPTLRKAAVFAPLRAAGQDHDVTSISDLVANGGMGLVLHAMAADDAGHVVVAGEFSGQITSLPNDRRIESNGDLDMDGFVTAFRGGAPVWSAHFASQSNQMARVVDVTVGIEGNVYVLGEFDESFILDSTTNEGNFPPGRAARGQFVAKFAPGDGAELFVTTLGHFAASDIEVDHQGRAAIVGQLQGGVTVADGLTFDSPSAPLVVRLDEDGGVAHATLVPCGTGANFPVPPQLAVMPEGDLFVAAGSATEWAAGEETLPAGTFLVRLDPEGNPLFGRTIHRAANNDNIKINDLTWGHDGRLYVAGALGPADGLDLDGLTPPDRGGLDAAILRLGEGLEFQWGQAYGSPARDEALAVRADLEGRVYVAGLFSGFIEFRRNSSDDNPITLNPGTSPDGFLVRLTPPESSGALPAEPPTEPAP